MKLVVQVKLLPTPVQASALEATLRACNRAATHASTVAFNRGVRDRSGLQKEVYADLKAAFGLSAQPAVRAVKKVVDAYATLRANLRAGNLGPSTSRRYRKALGTPIVFRPEAAQPFDDRCLSWQHDARTVSIWTVDGRMKGIRYTGHADQLKTLVQYRRGESDLIRRGGKWFLIATCEIPDAEMFEPVDWIGVDRGIANLATTSDGTNYQGRRLSRYRRWQARKRAELQKKKTRSARRRLSRRKYKEQRHATHVNHVIAKGIVSVAVGVPPARTQLRAWGSTGRGIAVEALDGIRERVRLRRDQRATLSSWPFHQLGQHLAYKARRAGVPFLLSSVRPRWTRRCRRRGQRARPRTLGVGIRHHARPATGVAGGRRCDP
ncbi:transposase [Streptomyces mirabilis]|uniref:transposase n=1 Tax=Streptomyces mirabilis TaxID=68239 RepID=UPI003316B480